MILHSASCILHCWHRQQTDKLKFITDMGAKKDRPRRAGLYVLENYTRAAVMMAIL